MMSVPRSLRLLLLVTDLGFIAYWSVTALHLLPPELAFNDYRNPLLVAWNWSFAPLDLLASACGLWALRLARRQDARAYTVLIIALVLTCCAGLQAISFWATRGDFELGWWLPNLFLMLYPLWFLPALLRPTAAAR